VSEGEAATAAAPVFSPRAILAIVLVSVFAFAAFVTLLAYAHDLDHGFQCRANVYSKCATGFAGLSELLREDGAPTLINRTRLPSGRTEGLLIVTPEGDGGADVASLGFGGPVLVVAPKWQTTPDVPNLSWGRKAGLIDPGGMPQKDLFSGVTIARRSGVARPRLAGAAGSPFEGALLTPGPVDSLQTMGAKGWTPVLVDEMGRVVMARAPAPAASGDSAAPSTGAPQIYLLADPDLLNTQGLANLDTLASAVAIVRTLRAGEGPVIFDVTLNGYKIEHNALKLMFDPPFLAVTLCLAAALALAGLQALVRFGAVRRAGRVFALGKEALTDNSAQLIRLARREPKMAPRYAALTRAAAAKAVAAPPELTGDGLSAFLDRMGAQRGATDKLSDLVDAADRAHDRASLTAVAQKLYRWRLEMTRERH
jgi:hypothetical protein